MTRERRTPEPFTANETAMLEALRAAREDGHGLHTWELKEIGGLVYVDSFIRKLRAHGFVLGFEDGMWLLGEQESGVERGTRPGPPAGGSPPAPARVSLSADSEPDKLFDSRRTHMRETRPDG